MRDDAVLGRALPGHWKWYHLKAWLRFPIRLP